jgi:hypothetical protein
MAAAVVLSVAAVALRVHPSSDPVSRRGALAYGAAAAASISLEPAPPSLAATASAVVAQRFSFQSTISPLPPFGALSSFEDELTSPKGSTNPSVRVRFEFPSQWSQIDKALGGITLVRCLAPHWHARASTSAVAQMPPATRGLVNRATRHAACRAPAQLGAHAHGGSSTLFDEQRIAAARPQLENKTQLTPVPRPISARSPARSLAPSPAQFSYSKIRQPQRGSAPMAGGARSAGDEPAAHVLLSQVDGNTGLKCYVLRAPLPGDETLAFVPKAWFGETIFDEKGAIVRGGAQAAFSNERTAFYILRKSRVQLGLVGLSE